MKMPEPVEMAVRRLYQSFDRPDGMAKVDAYVENVKKNFEDHCHEKPFIDKMIFVLEGYGMYTNEIKEALFPFIFGAK